MIVYECLISPSEIFEKPTKKCFGIIFVSFCITTKIIFREYLKGNDNTSKSHRKEPPSVRSTNSIAE